MKRSEREEAWAAMSQIHEALSTYGPVGLLPSEEQINADPRYGPTFSGYALCFVEAIAKWAAVIDQIGEERQ